MSRASRPPSVEPLSDLAWRRIENSLFEQLALEAAVPRTRTLALEPRRRMWPVAAALAACAAALAVYVATSPGDHAGHAMQSSRIVTAEAPSEVSVGDASLEVGSNSAILVTTQADRVEVVLERGTVECKVAKRDQRPPFVVRVGDVTVEVVGTEFSVTRRGDSAEVEVFEGIVKVLSDGELHHVHAGSRWPAVEDVADSEADHEVGGEVATAQDTPAVRRRRSRPTRDAPPPRVHEADRKADRVAAERSPRQRYEQAAALEASDPSAAIALYRNLAASPGPWAANALYAQARLELELGRARRARRHLQRYLDRYPEGANAADARTLLLDL